MAINLVWLKKDLRTHDHKPLSEACKSGNALALYIFEDELKKQPEYSLKHQQFIGQSLLELKEKLANYKVPLLICDGDVIDALKKLHSEFTINKIHSHMETGTFWTFQRDLKVKDFCSHNKIEWCEHHQFAIVRGQLNRDRWNKYRDKIIARRPEPTDYPPQEHICLKKFNNYSTSQLSKLNDSHLQKGGESKAHEVLQSFLTRRFENYQKHMSKPMKAWNSCSRLSPYITWGNISLSQINQRIEQKTERLKALPNGSYKLRNLNSFDSRLWWHCHFIQKLETEPEVEFKNFNSGFNNLREHNFNEAHFQAWCRGETGYPIIDACMRALHKHGWINFRMRAMLISFASYHLWMHWQKPAWHLARLFTDFEPGIHFSQIQMQSGTTGINAIRIYSPIKQSQDQDPEGLFIKKFVPELEGVDKLYIHQPELMPPLIQQISGCVIGKDYPAPIVDHKTAYDFAKEKIFERKAQVSVRRLSKKVYNKHGSRKNKHFPSQQRN